MPHLYDTIEPSVIDDEMLNEAVFEQGPKDEAGRLAEEEGIDFDEVQSLRLDYKNILKIDSLWEFTNLTKLQMDNNIIEKIEGLDKLVHLVWLDLSFNNIEVIEGLDTLTKLQDLTLFNNRISSIENMDTLVNLEIFSIGNNDLRKLDNLIYLRRFPKLKTLNLKDNPFCELEIYNLYTAAVLPNLVYLDYRLMDDELRKEGYDRFQIQVEELLDNERKSLKAKTEEESKAADYAFHCLAFVEELDGPQLFDNMYKDDPEGTALCELPNSEEFVTEFRETFTGVCHEMFEYGLEAYEKRTEDVKVFFECLEEAKLKIKTASEKLIDAFVEEKTKRFQELRSLKDTREIQRAVHLFNCKVTRLWDKLMSYEMILCEQIEETIQSFDLNLQDLVSNFSENIQGLTTRLRAAENIYYEKMMKLADELLHPIMRGDIEDVSDALMLIFTEKDTMVAAVCASHDAHLLKIDLKEEAMTKGINRWMTDLLKKTRAEEEHTRNRHRVVQIAHIIDYFREQLNTLEMPEP